VDVKLSLFPDGSGQLHNPVALLPDKEPLVPNREEAVWASEPVSMVAV